MINATYGCFLKWWYTQITHFNRVFHYKPSILGYPYFRKHPHTYTVLRFCRENKFVSESCQTTNPLREFCLGWPFPGFSKVSSKITSNVGRPRGNEKRKRMKKTKTKTTQQRMFASSPRCWCGLPFPTQWNVHCLGVGLLTPSRVLTSAVRRFYDLQLNVRDESGAEITSLEDFWSVFLCNEIRSIHSFHELRFCSVLCYLMSVL